MRCCFLPHSETVLDFFQGGGNCNIDEDTLMSLLNTACEREPTVPSSFLAVKFNNVEAEQSKSQEISPPQLAVRSSDHLRSLPCQVKVKEPTFIFAKVYLFWMVCGAGCPLQMRNEPLLSREHLIFPYNFILRIQSTVKRRNVQ